MATTLLFKVFTFPLGILPMPLVLRVGELLGSFLHVILSRRRRLALENIRQALPFLRQQHGWVDAGHTPERVVQELFCNLGRSIVEILKVYSGCGEQLLAQVEFRGLEHLEAAKSKGRGVLLVSGHCGNWELAALAVGVRVQPLASVARPLSNAWLNGQAEQLRCKFGNRIIYKAGALKGMLREFRENRAVAVLTDQAVSSRGGCLAPFLGRTAWVTRMPVIMARKPGVPLVPAFGHYEGGRHVVTFHPEVPLSPGDDEATAVQNSIRVLRCLEEYIIRNPAQWFWVHDRWKHAGDPVLEALRDAADVLPSERN